jgi:hypothetical protein
MSAKTFAGLFFLGTVALIRFASAQAELPERAVTGPKPDAAAVQKAIGELGHEDYTIREAASKLLWLAGLDADAALRKASGSNDPEVKMRARLILEKFELGLTPDMPPEFESLLVNFRLSEVEQKRTTLMALIDDKKVKLALQLARTERDSVIRDSLVSSASRHAQRFVPEMLIREELNEAEAILEAVDIAADSTLERLTAMLLVSSRLPDRLRAAEEKLKLSTSPALAKRVMYYRRANGDLAGAAELAGQNQLAYYQRAILLEKGDWAGAAAVQDALYKGQKPAAEAEAFSAALHFFAGNQGLADAKLQDLRTFAADQVSSYWDAAEAHLACEQPEQATKLLAASVPAAASYFHFLRMNYAESQKLGGITKETKFDQAWYDALVDGGLVATQSRMPRQQFARDLARQLHLLGERERAKEIAAVLRKTADADKSGQHWPMLINTDVLLNDRPQALLDLEQAIGRPGVSAPTVFSMLYSKDFMLADALYHKMTADGPKRDALQFLEQLFGPAGYSDEEREALVVKVAAIVEPWQDIADYRLHIRAGEIFVKLGERDQARRWFERAASSTTDATIRLGDLAREDGDWKTAEKWYRAAFEKLPALPLPRYLLGETLISAGQREEGEKEQRRATLATIAPVTRYALAFQLKERGLNAAAAEQALVLLRSSNPTVQHPTLAAGHLRANVISKESPAQAADGWQRWLLSMLSGVNNYSLFDHYLLDPELIHRNRARALLADGKPDAAIGELRKVLILLPGDMRMVEEFFPLLEKVDRRKVAFELLEEVADRYEQTIREFPQTSHHRRELAYMLARCGWRLDDALKLAEEAVKLEGSTAYNHDALAEVNFVRGDQPAAIKAGQRALALEKQNAEFQARLKRWQNETKKKPDT